MGERSDAPLSLPQLIPGGMTRAASAVPLLNARPVLPGLHHDVPHPIPVVASLRWATGLKEMMTVALEGRVREVTTPSCVCGSSTNA